jgi:hypothetical protein
MIASSTQALRVYRHLGNRYKTGLVEAENLRAHLYTPHAQGADGQIHHGAVQVVSWAHIRRPISRPNS